MLIFSRVFLPVLCAKLAPFTATPPTYIFRFTIIYALSYDYSGKTEKTKTVAYGSTEHGNTHTDMKETLLLMMPFSLSLQICSGC
jgi:hypothetical protein